MMKQKEKHSAFTLIELLTVIAVIGVLAAILIPALGAVKDQTNVSKSSSNLRQMGVAFNLYANENNNKFPPINDTSVGSFGQVWFVSLMPYLLDQNKAASEMSSGDLSKSFADVYRCPVYQTWWEDTYPNATGGDWNQLGYGMSYTMIYDNGWPWYNSDTGQGDAQNYAAPRYKIKKPAHTIMLGPNERWNLNLQSSVLEGYTSVDHGIKRARRHGDFALYLMADGSVQSLDATPEALLPYVVD